MIYLVSFIIACTSVIIVNAAPAGCNSTNGWWYESTKHGSYYKNVKDYGAKGDGVTDDTAAITNALTSGRTGTYTTKTPTASMFFFFFLLSFLVLVFSYKLFILSYFIYHTFLTLVYFCPSTSFLLV